MSSTQTNTRTDNVTPITWVKFAASVLSIAKLTSVFGADPDLANVYMESIRGNCPPDRAHVELQRIYREQNRLPAPSEVIAAATSKRSSDWITIERIVIHSDGSEDVRTYARQIPMHSDPARYVRPGERLLHATTDGVDNFRWQQCSEGQEFHALLERIAGKGAFEKAVTLIPET